MKTTPRFLKEYANYLIMSITYNPLMKEGTKKEKIETIQKISEIGKDGYISITEAMKGLSKLI